jgi:3'-5' exonuclease
MAFMKNPYLQERQYVSLDLETVPVDDPAVRAEIAAGIVMPGSISKPETIALWEQTKKPQLVEEAFGRGGLSATTGRICCIGLASATFEHTFCGPDEAEIIHLAYEFLSTLGEPVTYVGHNLQGFDLPFLRMRSIIHRRKPPLSLRKAFAAKPWEEQVVGDTMLQWSHDRDKRISLDRLCRLLGIESPKANGTDGSAVYGLYKAGKLQDIADYCLADCRAALAVYNRIAEVA